MGNSHPRERYMGHSLRCCKCNLVLPPCFEFSDFHKNVIHGRHVYVFNGGRYYRPVGVDAYECEHCFNKPIRDQERLRKEEENRREEERRREEEKRSKEEERRRQEEKRKEELNRRLEESLRKAQEQRENQQKSDISEECESRQSVLKTQLEFSVNYRSGSDELLENLSEKCGSPVPDLNLSLLTSDQLESIVSSLDALLFEDWIRSPPSLRTLEHAQVFLTERCALSLLSTEDISQQNTFNHMQALVEAISQSACGECESLLLTQALFLTLMDVTHHCTRETDAALLAKRWTEGRLSTEDLCVVEFLGTLMLSLQNTVQRASVFILKMETQCLELLLHTLTELNDNGSHSKSSEMLLRLVQKNQWTPVEALALLRALSEKEAGDAAITEVLTLVQVYNLPPDWTDDSGRSLIQTLEFKGQDKLQLDFQKTLRNQDQSRLGSALAEFKSFLNLDNSFVEFIKNIITDVIQDSENTSSDVKDPLRSADHLQKLLFELCKAVFDTKGWWPTVQHMLSWCVSRVPEDKSPLEWVGVEHPCVTAMIAASQVLMGNKLDFVFNSDLEAHQQITEWSDFYQHLGISINVNRKQSEEPWRDVYEDDIVFGTMDDFISDYYLRGFEAMETGKPPLSRGLIIEEKCLHASDCPKLLKLRENDTLVFAAEILEGLLANFLSKDLKLRERLIKAVFQVLHVNLNKHSDSGSNITISQKLTGKQLTSGKVYILRILENLLFAMETETKTKKAFLSGKLILDSLFACAGRFQASNKQSKELYRMVSDLVAQQMWSPTEALNLLVALTEHQQCAALMKIVHLMEIYQVPSEWTDEGNRSLLMLLNSCKTENIIQQVETSFKNEKENSIECLFDQIKQMEIIDKKTLEKSYKIVTFVSNLIKYGEIKNHSKVQQARKRSHGTDAEDLQEVLAALCYAVHRCIAEEKWWPRATQMISWCLLALSDTGRLLEMGTGEGKSCVIAMFAVLRALRGEKVDILSSSSVLCERDAEEWSKFYKYFGITVDTNTNKTEDKDRKECYQKDVVYGTIEAFAADHLRQIFEMKDVRTNRSFQCVIIDEVDSLLLDQGVQLTYLSSPTVSMQHLNVILAMIWSHVSQYGLLCTGYQTFLQERPASFFKAIFDSIDTEDIKDPMDILSIAEKLQIIPEGFTEEILKSEKDEFLRRLKTVSQEKMVEFFQGIEDYVPYGFTVYTLDGNGLLRLQTSSKYNNQDKPELTFLVLGEGLCCALYDSEEMLIEPIACFISEKIQYTPCENNTDKVSIPGFLKKLIEEKLPVWVQNAFLAKRLQRGREYVVENDSVCPVDFRSTGTVELSKKWGDGLQQFVEIKHQIKLSTISTVTNYISNISFFEKYHGKIYGTTGTLGGEADLLFLQNLYPNLSACKMPNFNRKKLFEVKGTLKTSAKEWKEEIKFVVKTQISPNSYRGGRAALVICETINTAEELYKDLRSIIPGEVILYCRNGMDSLGKIEKELNPGDVIVATNLAGRGTDIKVSKKVNNNGGLFVILSFLSENTRVDLQAFGRTARKGKPGSAMVIMTTDHLPESFRRVSSLEEAKETRDRLAIEKIKDMELEITEMKLREDLFSDYCETLQRIHRNTNGDEQRTVVSIMNEFWGIWLQIKSEEINKLKRNELQSSLKTDLSLAENQSQSNTSPCSSIYHYIKFGNIALDNKQWQKSMVLFEKAMKEDGSWAAIAFYSHAYCTIQLKEGDYLTKAREDLIKAQESLRYLSEDIVVCLQFVKMSSANSTNTETSSLEKALTTKCTMLSYFDNNINEALKKLDEIKDRGRQAVAKTSSMFTLVSKGDEDIQKEAYNMYSQGLKYVFSVEEEPQFPWGALLVFGLGVLQIIGGVLLTVFTAGTLAKVGMGLIIEGISDCIEGIESMVTGEFSWKSWAIEKAISIGMSVICFGVGKLISKGLKASKSLIKGIVNLKSMPKFISSQAKAGCTLVMKTNLKDAVKHTAKKIAEEAILYEFGKAEEALLNKVLEGVKDDVKKGIIDDVKSNMEKEPLAALIDSIVLSHLQDKQQLSELLQDKDTKHKLLAIFQELSNTASQPFYTDLSWQHKLNSCISQVIDTAKSEAKGKTKSILTAIQAIHMGALAADAIIAVHSLSGKFYSKLCEEMKTFKKGSSERERQKKLSATDTQLLKEFKQDLAKNISELCADALTEVFHQKFSSHIVTRVQGQVNGLIRKHACNIFNSDRTKEKLIAGQNNRYIAYMPQDKNSNHQLEGDSVKRSQLHAEKIRNSSTAGTILDARILSETTGTKIVMLTEDSQGKLNKMQQLNPSTKPARDPVFLIFYPKSDQHPEGHYDVLINNRRVKVTGEGKSCLYHALARGMKPAASEAEIASEAKRLRSVEAESLLRHPGKWEPFIKRKELTETIRGGDWYMAEGAGRKRTRFVTTFTESEDELRRVVGKVGTYKELTNSYNLNKGLGKCINADHQPPRDSIKTAYANNQNSRLAKAMVDVGGQTISDLENYKRGPKLPAVYVPEEVHRELSSTVTPRFRDHLAEAISRDDVVGTFKLTILGAMPRFMLCSDKGFKTFQENDLSKTRLSVFEDSFPDHSKEMVQKWYDVFNENNRNIMTDDHLRTITVWIDKKRYNDQNDEHRKQVSNILNGEDPYAQ